MMCSWLTDKFGVRWQIVPRVLMEGLRHPDAATRERVVAAMGDMQKIDHAQIKAALANRRSPAPSKRLVASTTRLRRFILRSPPFRSGW